MRLFAEDSYAPTRSLTVEAILSQIAISTLKHHHPPLKPGSRRVQSLCARRKPQWTVTFKHRYSRDRHFDRHGTEFAAKTPDEYEKMAGKFKYDPLPSGVKECRRSDGGIVRFDPRTAVFGTMSKERRIHTYMVVLPPYPDGKTAESYYVGACKK